MSSKIGKSTKKVGKWRKTEIKCTFVVMKIIHFVACFLVLVSCKTKKIENSEAPIVVEFGSGGGFTGETISYRIESKGELYKFGSLNKDSSLIKSISSTQQTYLKSLVNADTLSKINLDKFGNMTSFINLKKNGKSFKSFHWETGNTILPQPLNTLDSFLNTLIK